MEIWVDDRGVGSSKAARERTQGMPLINGQFHWLTFPEIFKDATLFFSTESACVATIIPAMDHIDSVLASTIVDGVDDNQMKLHPSITASLTIGKRTLNWYYNKTDHSEIFRITMSTFLCLAM